MPLYIGSNEVLCYKGTTPINIYRGDTPISEHPTAPANPVQQRGSTTYTDIYGSAAVAAPTGLSEGDVVYISIESDDPDWSLAGFTNIFSVQAVSAPLYMTILRGVVGASPPSGFTPTANGSPVYYSYCCTAFYDVGDLDDEVVGTPYSANPFGATTVNIPGITTLTDNSYVVAFTDLQYANATIAGWDTLRTGGGHDIYGEDFPTAGATGAVAMGVGGSYNPAIGVLVSIPSAST